MNTAALKRFAQQARVILKEGVQTRLSYWGFDHQGNITDEPMPVEGGVIFRGEGIDDPTLFKKWEALKQAVHSHGVQHIAEEAAYTWFNRLMAIRILAKNGYIRPQLEFESASMPVPLIVSNARRGQFPELNADERKQLNELLNDDSAEVEQFTLLISAFCRTNKLIRRIFGRIYDYTELLLPVNILSGNGFVHLLNHSESISGEDYRQVELIGWLYQFYISEKKDEVFKSFKNKKKAEAEDIPAATQIFTPNWIVKYMVQNTVGRLWLDLNPDSGLKTNMDYLVDNPDAASPVPLVSEVAEIKLLDPACGSGHILVEGFDILFDMYTEEGYSKREAVQQILRCNLYGLDIDLRAAQLANFALLLKAAAKDASVLESEIVPQVYAMPEKYEFNASSLRTFLGEETHYLETLQKVLTLMQQAQNLGSVMKIEISPDMREYLQTQLTYWTKRHAPDLFTQEDFDQLFPYIRNILLLTQKYEAVAANPPYMGSGNMNEELKGYVNKKYPHSKSDLMTVFMDVISDFTLSKGRYAMINLPSWLFLSSFENLREDILKNQFIESLLHFGRGIFGIDFGSVAFVIKKEHFQNRKGSYFRLHERNFQHIYYEDIELLFLNAKKDPNYKYDFSLYRDDDGVNKIPNKSVETGLQLSFPNISQSNFEKIPGNPIAYWVSEKVIEAFSSQGKIINLFKSGGRIKTHGNNEFIRCFWEVNNKLIGRHSNWIFIENGGERKKWYGNRIDILNWTTNARNTYESHGGLSNPIFWEKVGITWSIIGSGITTFRLKTNETEFTSAAPTIIPEIVSDNLYFVLSFLNTNFSSNLLKILNPTINTTVSDVLYLPMPEIKDVAVSLSKQNISISKQDWDSRETSWDFQQNELIRQERETIAVAYEDYLSYWTQQFTQLHSNEVELNRIFIDIYGLQEELTPEVKLKDVTILQEELDYNVLGDKTEIDELPDPSHLPLKTDEVIRQFISYAVGCMMGRYRLDRPGLHIAHPNPSEEETVPYEYKGGTFAIDDDGIIPLMDASCSFADNALLRLKSFICQVWSPETEIQNINFIESALGKNLETYLVKDFWKDHLRRYQKRPIYWLFSSPKGAFQVITYMHRMNKYTVEKIRSNYLLPHIQNLESRRELMEAESATLDRAGQRALEKIIKDITECREYDLYLKDKADQQIEFDLDDGVVVNHAKFGDVVAKLK